MANTNIQMRQKNSSGGWDNLYPKTKIENITDLTVTATELNYMDGVTSNVQTQLDTKATTTFVTNAVSQGIAASDAMIFKGTLGTDGTVTALPTTYKTGWTYRVITAGTYAGQNCEIGDLVIALVDRDGSSNANSDWTVAQTNIDGAITRIYGSGDYIGTSGEGSLRYVYHLDSGVTAGTYLGLTVDATGHVTAASVDTAPTSGSTNGVTSGGVYTALAELEGATVTRYGVKFGGSANSGATVQRLYNAFGLVAGVGTDTDTATNDFDNIYPWSGRKRCCGYWDENGSFVVNAYEGEPGYTTDGSNGEVWVETPLFYYKHTYGDDGSEEIVITSHPIGGFEPSPIHINADGSLRQKAYTAAYPMGLVDDMPTSRSGVYTPIMSLNSGMTNARKRGTNYTTTTTAEQYTKCLLMWVEFASRNIQAVMNGCSALSYSDSHTATVAEEATNRIIISNSNATAYVVGQGIGIGTALGDTSIANERTVTAITAYDDTNTAISFDGDPVNIAVGNIVFAIAWKTGSCDNVLTSSGSPVSNTSSKYTCIYRGEETPFGNAFEWISDVLFKREGSGTVEDPYSYDIYFLPDATKYNNGSITSDYVKVNYQLPTADGYVKKLGYDERFPFLRIPCEIGASNTTYYSDNYYRPAYALTAALVGGSWYNGASCGPCYWSCNLEPSSPYISRRARLSYRR